MSTTIDELFLKFNILPVDGDAEHHGIKGQKWGIRRERGPGGTVGSNPLHARDPRKLSDEDLRAAVNRMQLERQFSQLQAETGNSSRGARGTDFAKKFLADQGKKQLRRVTDKAVDIAVEQAIKGVAGKTGNKHVEEVARRLKPKKK